ncbi:MAG: peptidoglycan-binding domain-containing protein [Patescibacteria group bacterium]
MLKINSKIIAGLFVAVLLFVGAVSASAAWMPSTATKIMKGSPKADVMWLQQTLNATGTVPALVEDGLYGKKTTAAIKAFQVAHPASGAADGIAGKKTMAALNAAGANGAPAGSLCPNGMTLASNCTVAPNGNPGPTQTGPVTAMLSMDNPAAGTIIVGQAGADLAHITFSGSGTVSSITLTRGGVSNSSTLSNVYLYDGATRVTDGYSFNNTGSLTMNNVNLMVNGSKTISIKADVAVADYSVSVTLTSFTTGGVATVVSIKGNEMFIASGTGLLGTANLATATPSPVATSINAGSMNQTLWSNSINIGLHASKLHGMTVKQIGSAPANALANVALYVDGVNTGTAMINANMQFVFDLATPLSLTTGAHFFEVRGDVIGGAFRNFYISLEKAADLSIKDGQVQGGGVVSIAPTYLAGTLNNVNGGLVTINNGTLTITQDPAFSNTTTLVGGATTTKLAAWKFTAYGEDVKVNSLAFMPTFTALSAGTTLQNVGLYVNGGQVGSNATATTAVSLPFTNLGSNLTVYVGTPAVVELRGDVVSNSPAGTALTSGTTKFDLSVGSSNAQGLSSSQLTSTAAAGGQTLTIGNNVTFGATAGFSTSTKAPNTAGVKIGSFSLSAGSAEGLTVSNVSVTLPAGAGNTMQPASQLTNLTVKVAGNVIGTPIGNPVITTSNSYSSNLAVAQGTAAVFEVYADFGSGAATLTVTPSMAVTYRGGTSNLTTTSSTVAGSQTTSNVATIAAGGVKVDTGLSLSSRNIVTSSNFPIATYNFKVSNSVAGAVIKDVTFTFPANTVTTITMNGKTQGSISGTTATVYNVGVTVPATTDGVNVPVTVGLVCTGTANGCTANSPVTVNLIASTVTYNDGSAVQSITPTAGGAGSGSGAATVSHFVYASVPSFAVDSVQKTGLIIGAENKVGEVTIYADAAGQIKVNNLAFNVASTGLSAITTTGTRIADGNTTVSGSSVSSGCNVAAAASIGACVMTFGTSPSGFSIAAGGSKTFSLYMTIAATVAANTLISVSSSVTPGTTTWDDPIGGGTAQAATNVYNFPTASYSIRQ